jgi:hypothetical protein
MVFRDVRQTLLVSSEFSVVEKYDNYAARWDSYIFLPYGKAEETLCAEVEKEVGEDRPQVQSTRKTNCIRWAAGAWEAPLAPPITSAILPARRSAAIQTPGPFPDPQPVPRLPPR